MAVESLDGRRVLLLLVSRAGRDAAFVAGTARWDAAGGRLSVAPEADGVPVSVAGSARALRGFDPAVLPRLIVAQCRAAVLALAASAEACVAAFGDEHPAGAPVYRDPFFGLGGNGVTGEVFLFQGSDEAEWDENDGGVAADADASWSAEPWEPDPPAT